MSVLETIDGVEISTYGLQLAAFKGHLDLPAYKDILEFNSYITELRVQDEKDVEVVLIGQYASASALDTGIVALQTEIRSAIKLAWYFGNHAFTEWCVVKRGMKVEINRGFIAVVKFTLSITTET